MTRCNRFSWFSSIARAALSYSLAFGICGFPAFLSAQAAHFGAIRGARAETVKRMDASGAANFGSVGVGVTSSPMSLTFTFDAQVTLGSTSVVTQGAPNLDFNDAGTGTCTVGTAYSSGDTCTVDVTFTPTRVGTRMGAAVLFDNSGNVIATDYAKGIGSGPQVNFPQGLVTTLPITNLFPSAMTLDSSGNIYIADQGDDPAPHVYKETLSANGFIQSTIGSVLNDPFGVGVDGAGNVYISEELTHGGDLLKETLSAGSYTESIIGNLYGLGLAVDGTGDIYVAAYGTVEKFTPSGDSYTENTVASGFNMADQVAVDAAGNLYVSDGLNNDVYKETLKNGAYTQSTIASDLEFPQGVAVDAIGDVYIADWFNNRIVKETPSNGGYTQTVLPIGTDPRGVALDGNGNLYVALDSGSPPYVVTEDWRNPPSLELAAAPNSTTSVTVENTGNAALSFPVPASGTNPSVPSEFTQVSGGSSACPLVQAGSSTPGTLAAASSCVLTVGVSSGTTEYSTGMLVLTDNNLNAMAPGYATQSISLTSKGLSHTTLSSSGTTLKAGQLLTLTATVDALNTDVPLAGQVQFAGVGSPSPAATPNGNGVATWSSSTLAAGTYTASASYPGDPEYEASSSNSVSFKVIIGPPAKVIPVGANWTVQYGSAISICAEVTDAGSDPVTGITVAFSGAQIAFSPASAASGSNGQACTAATPLAAGSLVATGTVSGIATPATFDLAVTPAPLRVELAENSRPYGAPNPVFTVHSIRGLLKGDTVTVAATSTAALTSPLGYYPITVTLGGAAGANYTVTNQSLLHVRKAVLTVFPDGEGVTYGQTPAPPTKYFFTGFANGDTASVVAGAPVLSTAVTSTTPVGLYKINAKVGTLTAANYSFFPYANVLQVYKALLTVTANSLTMTQGSAVPTLTYTLTGFVNGDTAGVVSGAPLLTTTATSSSPPGTYPIYVTRGSLTAANYDFEPTVNGVMTVVPQ